LSLAVLLLTVLGSVAWAKPKVAILGLEVANSGGSDPKDAANAAKLTEELRKIPRGGVGKFDFAPNSNRELQDEKLMGNCDTEKPDCMSPIGTGLAADFLIYGRVERTIEKGKDGYRATIRILNVKAKKLETDKPVESFVPMGSLSSGEALEEWAQKTYAKVTGEKAPAPPDRPVEKGPGKLVVNSSVKDGAVLVGGAKKGRLEDGTFTLSLPEGSHEIAIEAPGHKRFEETITITSGKTKTVNAELVAIVDTKPPLPPSEGEGGGKRTGLRVLMWAALGAAAAGGAYWAYGYTKITDAEYKLCTGRYEKESRMDCLDPTAIQRIYPADQVADQVAATAAERTKWDDHGKKWGKQVNYVAIPVTLTGVALAVVGLVGGYVMSPSSGKEKQSAAGRRTRRELTVTPVISPDGGGATVRFDW
jgi:hypothetical protein